MLTKLFFSHFFCTEKPFTKNISITSFSQYTTICFVSFSLFGFQWTFGWRYFLCTESNQRNFIRGFLYSHPSFCILHSEFCIWNAKRFMVGPSGLEPPTSCLSGTRSNLLSYEPMRLVWTLFTLRFLRFLFWKLLCLPFFSKKVSGGDDGIRTHDPLLAGQVLSQLSYTPKLNAKCRMQNAK